MRESIVIKGAAEHNLKNIDVEIPRNKLVVITGLSGSGKSSLAFDTIYAEGQRRYIESLSTYARQFLGQMQKPKVDFIEGLSPAIAIQQRPLSHNPRSIVATITEIYDYLRLIFGRIGKPHCPSCGVEVKKQTLDQIVDQILSQNALESHIQILAPVVRAKKGENRKLFEQFKKDGYTRVRIDGIVTNLDDPINLDKNKKHSIDVIVDRLILKEEIRKRLADSIQIALGLSAGIIAILNEKNEELLFNESLSCVNCGINLPEISPRMFSFNSPFGACEECSGLGIKTEIDPDLLIPDKTLSINDGAIAMLGEESNYYYQMLETVAKHFGFSLDTPFEEYDKRIQDIILWGTDEKINFEIGNEQTMKHKFEREYEGFAQSLQRRYLETKSDFVRNEIIAKYMAYKKCPVCKGDRLKPEILAVTVDNENIAAVTKKSILDSYNFFKTLPTKLTETENQIAKEIIKEINARLEFLLNVGLDYITLDRPADTLSAGEAQRIHLATQIGSNLVGVLYVLDEPSIGLHQRDNLRLINTLKRLRDIGNTVIVVEHDEEMIRSADYILDLGPGAGVHGGYLVAQGPLETILNAPDSLTGQYLNHKKSIPIPETRRPHTEQYLIIRGARENNLKNIDVKLPLGLFICVTGVSGAGKSSLITEILSKALTKELNRANTKPGEFDRLEGLEHLDKAIIIDQSPIGRTPRSNPATYTGVFTDIRDLFANSKEAKLRGYKPGRFSFNVKGGRCEFCEGAGIIRIDMYFLPSVHVPCEVCKGKRFNLETLDIKYNGKNINEVLDMTVEEALEFYKNIPKIERKLRTLYDVGLGYIQLGQSAPQLSGGEAQRVKLAKELSKVSTGHTFYILDEPTTGLHFDDIRKLLEVLNRLVEKGNTVLVIEHNMDVIKTADWILDLGPEGGDKGGRIVAEGTPEEICQVAQSYTGQFLKHILN